MTVSGSQATSGFQDLLARYRGDRKLVLVIVAVALLLDNMLLTSVGEYCCSASSGLSNQGRWEVCRLAVQVKPSRKDVRSERGNGRRTSALFRTEKRMEVGQDKTTGKRCRQSTIAQFKAECNCT